MKSSDARTVAAVVTASGAAHHGDGPLEEEGRAQQHQHAQLVDVEPMVVVAPVNGHREDGRLHARRADTDEEQARLDDRPDGAVCGGR